MDLKALERDIFKRFKNRGWSITSAAIKGLLSVLQKEVDMAKVFEDVVSEITERMDKREVKSSVITVELMEEVCASLSTDEKDIEVRKFKLIDAFAMPRISYDASQKMYSLTDPPIYSMHGDIDCRANMYKERLHLALNRALRSGFKLRGMTTKRASGAYNEQDEQNPQDDSKENEWEISTLESLLGDTGHIRVLIGFLTQPEEGKWFLEDHTGSMWLDFKTLQHHAPKLFTEGSIVVLKGAVSSRNQSRLEVFQLVMLDPEHRSDTLGAMDIFDPFHKSMRPREILAKQEAERADRNVVIIIISDCCFSNQIVCDNLRTIFSTYESQLQTELLFVLLGPFVNKDFNSTGGRAAARAAFAAFGETLTACPRLCEHSRFLLVPAANDPGNKSCWPRPSIPEELVKPLRKRIKRLTLASNPCRVLFYNQEIVFFREDMLRKMLRHSLRLELNGEVSQEVADETLQEQLVDTILSQAHLFPLPPTVKPVNWDLDYTMRLHPLPQLLVLADHASDYKISGNGCTVVNPGSFLADASFMVYSPCDRTVEFSGLNG